MIKDGLINNSNSKTSKKIFFDKAMFLMMPFLIKEEESVRVNMIPDKF